MIAMLAKVLGARHVTTRRHIRSPVTLEDALQMRALAGVMLGNYHNYRWSREPGVKLACLAGAMAYAARSLEGP